MDREEEIIPGRIVLAVIQDRYSTIGLISAYLQPQSKGEELRELVKWMKSNKVDHPLYISGDFNQADVAFPDAWNDLFEGSLEVKLPTIWRDEKQSRAEAQRRGRLEERR